MRHITQYTYCINTVMKHTKGYRRCLCLSICLSVRPSVNFTLIVCTITRNFHQTCILGYSQLVLKIYINDLDLQGHFGRCDSEFLENRLVRTIICNGFEAELQSPNFSYQTCTLGYSQLIMKMEVFDLDLQGHFDHFVLEIRLVRAAASWES